MVHENDVTLGDSRIFYRSLASPEHRDSIILLHGRSFTSRDWLSIGTFERFSGMGFNVYAPDYPGFGNSTDDGKFKFSRDFKNSSRFVHDFGKKLNLSRFALMGPSMGGGIVLRTLLDFPEVVSFAIVIGSAGVEQMKSELQNISTPVLIIWGENDDVIKKEDGIELRTLVKNSELKVIPGATHPAYLDNPSVFFDEVTSFIDRQRNRSEPIG